MLQNVMSFLISLCPTTVLWAAAAILFVGIVVGVVVCIRRVQIQWSKTALSLCADNALSPGAQASILQPCTGQEPSVRVLVDQRNDATTVEQLAQCLHQMFAQARCPSRIFISVKSSHATHAQLRPAFESVCAKHNHTHLRRYAQHIECSQAPTMWEVGAATYRNEQYIMMQTDGMVPMFTWDDVCAQQWDAINNEKAVVYTFPPLTSASSYATHLVNTIAHEDDTVQYQHTSLYGRADRVLRWIKNNGKISSIHDEDCLFKAKESWMRCLV